MGDRNNALGVKGEAEKALIGLSLKYEVETGKQVRWLTDTEAVFDMVQESVDSDIDILNVKANQFLESLPGAVRYQFVVRGIEPKVKKTEKKATYRGVSFLPNSRVSSAAPNHKEAGRNKIWRGAVYS